jgi:DNA-binding response OmpR family regulator
MRVLVVEDQAELADDIAEGLRDQGIGADVAYDGPTGIEKALVNSYDVVVLEELVARVRSLARRAPAAVPVIVRGDIVFDRARRRVSRAGRSLSLTRKEMGVLEELLTADGGVVSTEDLLERVWDENADPFTRTVTVTIGRLRRKLGEPDPIDTVVGSGYRLP